MHSRRRNVNRKDTSDTPLRRDRSFVPLSRINELTRSFSPFEKVLFGFFVGIALFGSLGLLYAVNAKHLTSNEPVVGGSLKEGLIGFPRFVNPLLAISEADRDLTALLYSGLTKALPDGTLSLDLAESVEVSEDQLAYTFTIREDAVFHDGEPVTADDVMYTVHTAQDPAIKSPRRANWDGVLVEKVDEKTVRFVLPQPYGSFLENTSIGILPEHIWRGVSASEFPFIEGNTEPIGSGPYKIASVSRNTSGIPTRYTLTRNAGYALGAPYIERITLQFFAHETEARRAYEAGDISSLGGLSQEYASMIDDGIVYEAPLARIFAVFFNLNLKLFTEREVRQALDYAIDRDALIEAALSGKGAPIYGPIPPGILLLPEKERSEKTRDARVGEARAFLEDAGWELDENGVYTDDGAPLAFSIATLNIPDLVKSAEYVVEIWREVGADVSVKVFDQSDLNQSVIRPRKYDALLFGEVVGRELDLFAFWHSSQRNDPGLNVSLYANITADSALEKMRRTSDPEERRTLYETFIKETESDIPAIFLYSPTYTYVLPEDVGGVDLGVLSSPADRFAGIHTWFIETKRLWHFFTN